LIEYGGWYFPDGEAHLPGWLEKNGVKQDGRLCYQHKKQVALMSYCPRFRNAIDVGAHVGLWSFYLAKRFAHLYSFEPVAAHRECFTRNVTATNVTLHPVALGDKAGTVSIHSVPDSSGDSSVSGTGDIPMRMLDSYDYDDIDCMKLDNEGFELFALKGGEQTILRCMPAICVEQKPGKAKKYGLPETGAVDYLKTLGYRLAQEIGGDYLMIPA
jgi:FkbM family methyltransferase